MRTRNLASVGGRVSWGRLFVAGWAALAGVACNSAPLSTGEGIAQVESALVCNGGSSCTCNPIFGIGFAQGTDGTGTRHNFELAVPHSGGGLSAYYRDNTSVAHVNDPIWFGPTKVGTDDLSGLTLIENTTNGNLEAIGTIGDRLVHYWRDRTTKAWSSATTIATGVTGQPGFVQSTSTTTPNNFHNFEVVVPLASGGLAHYWRNNSVSSMPWNGPSVFATGRTYAAASLVESNFAPNRLEVVARSGSSLYFTWRNTSWVWSTPTVLSADGQNIAASGVHQFIQGHAGTKGNFELVVPVPGGGLWHYYRDNDDGNYPWHSVGAVDPLNTYSSAGVIWSEYGNLEVVGRRTTNGSLAAFYYSGGWNRIGTDANGQPAWAGNVFGGEPCCDPASKGQWSDPILTGAIGIHASLLRTGKVLFFGFENDENMGYSELFDPASGSSSVPGGEQPHAFCSGHNFLADGRLWVSGGHGDDHVRGSHLFDPVSQSWAVLPDMPNGRWYPTLTRLRDGSVVAISGSSKTGPLKADNPVNNTWQALYLSDGSPVLGPERAVPNPFSSDGKLIELYPFVFELPSGEVLVHSNRTSRFFTPSTNSWSSNQYATVSPYSRTYPATGSSLMLPLSPSNNYRAKILVIGGAGAISGGTDDASKEADSAIAASATVEQLDLGASPVQWQSVASMNFARVLATATLLPDGKVFVTGGSYVGRSDNANAPVQTPEMYDPSANTWTPMCAMRAARLYHSTAILLPDARVLTAGRDHAFNASPYKWPERRVEIYTPPYLLSGAPRPALASVPTTISHDANFSVTLSSAVSATNIASAVLMAPGSVTHAFNMSQRSIQLQVVSRSGSTLTLKAPRDAEVAPFGYYMLFVLSNQGVPSVAKFLKL